MPPKRKATRPKTSKSKNSRTESYRIVPHSNYLDPIPLEKLNNYVHFQRMPEKILKLTKLAHPSILVGNELGGENLKQKLFAIIVNTDDEVYIWSEEWDKSSESGDKFLHKIKELCGKKIVDIYVSHFSKNFFATTKHGDVYSWGFKEEYEILPNCGPNILTLPRKVINIPSSQKIVKVVTNKYRTFGLTEEGKLFTWWIKSVVPRPTQVLGPDGKVLKNISDVVTGLEFVVALDHQGKVYYQRECARTTKAAQVEVKNLERKVVQISAGYRHTLALTNEGKIIGWGHNTMEQVGVTYSLTQNSFFPEFIPYHLKNLDFKKVIACANMSIAELKTGGFYLWGNICVNRVQVKQTPLFVTECSNLDQVFAKYCQFYLPYPMRGQQLVESKENGTDSDTAENISQDSGSSTGSEEDYDSNTNLNSEDEDEISSGSISSTSAETKIDVKIKLEKKIKCEISKSETTNPSSEDQQASSSSTNLNKSTPDQNRKKGNVLFKIGNQHRRPDLISLRLFKGYAYFKNAMEGHRAEVKLNNITAAAFDAFIVYLEEDEIPLKNEDFENIISLMTFSDVKGIEDRELKEKCRQLIDLNINNAQDIYFGCSHKKLEEGRKLAFDFILKNLKIIDGKGLLDLNKFRPFCKDLHKLTGALLKMKK